MIDKNMKMNYLLNPRHQRFPKIIGTVKEVAFSFDLGFVSQAENDEMRYIDKKNRVKLLKK